jgi:hypothetical protein
MKKLFCVTILCPLLFFVVTTCAQITNNREKLNDLVAAELKGGIVLDTAFLKFCFSDSPDTFKEKLSQLILTKQIQADSGKAITYILLSGKSFNGFKFFLLPVFHNNALAELNLNFIPTTKQLIADSFVTVIQFEQLLKANYGKPDLVDSTTSITRQPESRFYWVRGNRKIYFVGMKQKEGHPDFLSLRFTDLRNPLK